MTVRLNPYLSFRNSAREAMTFYHSVFGGDLQLMTFGEQGMDDPAEADKIMHGQLTAPDNMTLMGADTPNSMELADASNISVSLSGDDEPALQGYWNKLIIGGTPITPLAQAPWGDKFGMLRDRFGITWLVNIAGPAA